MLTAALHGNAENYFLNVADVLRSFLRRHQPVPPPADLHAKRRQQISGQTPYRDAAASVRHRRHRLPQHACRSVRYAI